MQVTKRIYALRIPFHIVSAGVTIERYVNAFLVLGDKVLLVDSGVAGAEGAIFSALHGVEKAPTDIAMTVLTHAHPDHIGALWKVRQQSGCTVAVHAVERAWVEDVNRQAAERPVPGFHSLVEGSTPVDRSLADSDVLAVGGVRLEVLHTPGHSPGSISLLLPDEGALICGDVVPLPGEMPIYDDALAAARSLRRLQQLNNLQVLLSAWDAPRWAGEIPTVLQAGLDYLQRLHLAVLAVAGDRTPEALDLCRRVVEELRLSPVFVNPLVARSLISHLRCREIGDLREV